MFWNILVLLIGLLILTGSIFTLSGRRDLAKGTVVLGEVIDIQHIHYDKSSTYVYTVEFLTRTGEVRQCKRSIPARDRDDHYAPGQKVPLIYYPHHARTQFLELLKPLESLLSIAGWGVILVGIGSSLLIASFLMHTSLDTLSLVEVAGWTAGLVVAVRGLILALSQFHLLQSGIQVTAVRLSPDRSRMAQFVTQTGETSYYCGIPTRGVAGEKVPLLYDPGTPIKIMYTSMVRPLRWIFLGAGNGAILCLTGLLLMLFGHSDAYHTFFSAILCMIGLWVFFRIGLISLIDNWRSAAAHLPYPSYPGFLFLSLDEDDKLQRSTNQNRPGIYNPTDIARSLIPALLQSSHLLLVTGALGTFFFSIGLLLGKNMLSSGLLLEASAMLVFLVIVALPLLPLGMMRTVKTNPLVSAIIIIGGFLLVLTLFYGVHSIQAASGFYNVARGTAQGTVQGTVQGARGQTAPCSDSNSGSDIGTCSCVTKITFAPAGQHTTFTTTDTQCDTLAKGTHIEVLYDPRHPGIAKTPREASADMTNAITFTILVPLVLCFMVGIVLKKVSR